MAEDTHQVRNRPDRRIVVSGCLLVCVFAALATASVARTHDIHPGNNRIHALLPLLAARDTVRFVEAGRYEEEDTPLTLPDVPLTFLGAADLEYPAVIVTRGSRHLVIRSDLRVENLAFDGANTAEYGIYSQARLPNVLIVENCRFYDIPGDAISAEGTALAWCEIHNSEFHDIGQRALGFETADMVGALQVSNSTFHRIGTAIEVTEQDQPASVRISDITIHQANEGIVLRDVTDAMVSGVILSSIAGDVVGGSDHLAILNSCIFDSDKHQHVKGASCLNCLKADPHFYDTAKSDFSLLPESPCLWLGENHTPIGDPRWSGDATHVAKKKRGNAQALRWAGGISGGTILLMLLYSGVRRRFQRATLESLRGHDARYRAILEKSTEGILFFDAVP